MLAQLAYFKESRHRVDEIALTLSEARFEMRSVHLESMREFIGDASLFREGFALVNLRKASEHKGELAVECELLEIIAEALGASNTKKVNSTRRRSDLRGRQLINDRALSSPVTFSHTDLTAKSAANVLQALSRGDSRVTASEFAVINAWRPVRGPVHSMPLAVCDASTVREGDFVIANTSNDSGAQQIFISLFGSRHRWFYVPEMLPNEILLFNSFNPRAAGSAFTFHAAATLEENRSKPEIRESIELRVAAFW